ncbi:hypothetical protein D9M71_112030 [compost metagenome]
MTYSLEFDARALKEWHKLGDTIRQQFKKKLAGARPAASIRYRTATRSSYVVVVTGWFTR